MSSYDVIVIGSGAGGGTLVHRLASSGKRILLLERGDWLPREPQNWSAADVFVDNRYVSPDTWYDAETAKAFQPQIHYFVGGATKLYGAALYRLRQEDFGELPPPRRHLAGVAHLLRRDGAVLHAGRAALPGARSTRRGSDRAARERSVSLPGRLPRAAHPAAVRRPRGRGAPSLPRPVRSDAQRGGHAARPVRSLRHLRRLPVPRPRQVRRRGAGGAAGARAPERHADDERAGGGARHQPGGDGGHGGRGRARRCSRDPLRRHRRGVLRGGQLGQAAARLRQRQASRTAWPTGPTRWAATTRSTTARRCWPCRRKRTRRCSRRRSGSTTSTSAATTSSTRWATSRWSASRRRRCTAARSRSRPSSRPRGRWRTWRATRSTSGFPPRTCPAPTTGSRSIGTGTSGSATRRPTTSPRSACSTSSSRCSGTSGCTTTTSSRVTRT